MLSLLHLYEIKGLIYFLRRLTAKLHVFLLLTKCLRDMERYLEIPKKWLRNAWKKQNASLLTILLHMLNYYESTGDTLLLLQS